MLHVGGEREATDGRVGFHEGTERERERERESKRDSCRLFSPLRRPPPPLLWFFVKGLEEKGSSRPAAALPWACPDTHSSAHGVRERETGSE